MKTISVRVPLRADLAGGTLDLWPLYLFHPGACTVNVAIDLHAQCEISEIDGSAVEIHLLDTEYERRYETFGELAEDPAVALLARAIEHFELTGIRITTSYEAPRGSGLGGSSALAVALVRAMSEYAGRPVEGDQLIALVRDLETRLIKSPAGVQDYYPPVYGGLAALHLDPGAVVRRALSCPAADLAPHFLLHYSGVAHFSGTNNWEIYKRHVDGDARVVDGLERIAETSRKMAAALDNHDLATAGALLSEEWTNRKALIDGVSTAEIDAAIGAARSAGAWGAKVCGAGGGGCTVILTPAEKRSAVVRALAAVPGRVLDAAPASHGLELERTDAPLQTTLSFTSRRTHPAAEEDIEELYHMTRKRGAYRPYVLAEASVEYDELRSGTRKTVRRSLIAPVDLHAEEVDWTRAADIDPENVEFSVSPQPKRSYTRGAKRELVIAAARASQRSLKQFLAARERFTVFHNAAFSLYSEPDETRDDFLARCLEEADRRLETETDRLESTYRRRIDQIKQRSERDQRDRDNSVGDEPTDQSSRDSSISWGQTLYNITSGKPAMNERPQSVGEADSMQKIAQLQRTWDREREVRHEELRTGARAIEELTLAPAERNIDLLRYLVVWSPGL